MRHALCLLLLAALPARAEPVIAFSGEAEFGVTYRDANGSDVHGRYTLDIEPRVRTDSGLTLGAQVRLRGRPGEETGIAGARYYVSTGTPRPLPRR